MILPSMHSHCLRYPTFSSGPFIRSLFLLLLLFYITISTLSVQCLSGFLVTILSSAFPRYPVSVSSAFYDPRNVPREDYGMGYLTKHLHSQIPSHCFLPGCDDALAA